jgi:type I restriction enzyme M protein
MARSIEEIVEDHFKRQLNGLGVRYYRKTESVNVAIDRALRVSDSKSGGSG